GTGRAVSGNPSSQASLSARAASPEPKSPSGSSTRAGPKRGRAYVPPPPAVKARTRSFKHFRGPLPKVRLTVRGCTPYTAGSSRRTLMRRPHALIPRVLAASWAAAAGPLRADDSACTPASGPQAFPTDIGRDVLGPNDGWASTPPGTTGGSAAVDPN